MKIEFADGAAGFHEAHELKKAIHHYVNAVHHGHSSEILQNFELAADEQMDKSDFESLREEAVFDDRVEEQRISPLRTLLDAIMGPSAGEQEMARQRMEALDRAQRAEAASFDAVAEAGRVAQQIAELEAAVEKLRNK